jgi:hypothetical protein
MRYRLSRDWPLDHGRVLAPSGTMIDSNSDDDWSRLARGLTPPWDVQALDDECYQLLLRAYPGHRHLMGPPPPPGRANRRRPNQNQTNKHEDVIEVNQATEIVEPCLPSPAKVPIRPRQQLTTFVDAERRSCCVTAKWNARLPFGVISSL